MTFSVSNAFRQAFPQFRGAVVEAKVKNTPFSDALWTEIKETEARIAGQYTTESLKQHPSIAATRTAYRTFGKDPSRYRPSSEQLIRRILQGKGLYQIDTLVDIGNLVSILTGYSIGVIDADKVVGDEVTLGIGEEGEPYEGIGRGVLNIAQMPVYRDSVGAFASPTSDSTRTMVRENTSHVFVIVNGYDGDEAHIRETAQLVTDLLTRYAEAESLTAADFK